MNSYSYICQEMTKRGVPANAQKASAIPVVMDIMANTDRNWTDYIEGQKELEKEKRAFQYSAGLTRAAVLKDMEKAKKEALACTKDVRAFYEDTKKKRDELDKWIDALCSCETAEARDRVRLAYCFNRLSRTLPKDKDADLAYDRFLAFYLSGLEKRLDEMISKMERSDLFDV